MITEDSALLRALIRSGTIPQPQYRLMVMDIYRLERVAEGDLRPVEVANDEPA